MLYGISCRNYEAAAETIPGAIGLSGSTVSRGFIQASTAKLREFQERDLSSEDVVAVVLDGKTFADAVMVIAVGITISGEKRFLGFVETDTENERVLTPFLRSLVERGLDLAQGVLERFSNRPCTTWGGRGTSARTDAGGLMRAYSMDLRERVLPDSDAGMKAADVAAKYRVSGSWVRLLKQRRRETGEVAPRVQRPGRRGMLEPHLHTLAALRRCCAVRKLTRNAPYPQTR